MFKPLKVYSGSLRGTLQGMIEIYDNAFIMFTSRSVVEAFFFIAVKNSEIISKSVVSELVPVSGEKAV